MKRNGKKENIERSLRDIHNMRQEIPVSSEWHEKVMAHVRRLGALPYYRNDAGDAAMVWRFAAAASMSALILLLYSFNAGIGPEHETARIFLNDPLGFIVSQSFLP